MNIKDNIKSLIAYQAILETIIGGMKKGEEFLEAQRLCLESKLNEYKKPEGQDEGQEEHLDILFRNPDNEAYNPPTTIYFPNQPELDNQPNFLTTQFELNPKIQNNVYIINPSSGEITLLTRQSNSYDLNLDNQTELG